MEKEKAINFKVNADLYKKIKIKTVTEDKTIKNYVTQLILQDLEKEENK